MRNLRWVFWYFWEGLPTFLAFPINSSQPAGARNFWSTQWENYWPSYVAGVIGLFALGFTLAGCMCCRRQRRPKGFQDDAGTGKEFKDASTAGTETTIERVPSSSLELEVPRILTSSREKIQFDEISCNYLETRSAIKPPSSSQYGENEDEGDATRDRACNEWYEGENFPREKLKYLREIGRGWFGKVVEGTTITDEGSASTFGKSRGVVVRILTEGSTTREKAWFLGESTPYLKLHHPNILELLGFCLEADPYLLLFESCPIGDLKHFLRSNRDNGETLRKENLPMRIALNIVSALEHMHENGFAHTDLSARNCLVAQDLTAKLGDYGVGVEKYPHDYYVVGDRALPIRWSAPESLECTETTIETRAITPLANIWSYGLVLWEIANWGERPYDDLGDEQIIESIFTNKSEKSMGLLQRLTAKPDLPVNFREALEATWKFVPGERSSLRESREILCGERIENFERRWQNLKPNVPSSGDKSASLQDLRGSVDSGSWQGNDKNSLRANFRLGPEEPINCTSLRGNPCQAESGSETEEESWRGRVERGVYTEKVKQKSKSVADLMVLVHIDSDSDVESSLGPQNVERPGKKRLPPSGSDGDLRSAVIADEFDEALRKLRDPNTTGAKTVKNLVDDVKLSDDVGTTRNVAESVRTTRNVAESVGTTRNVSQSVKTNESMEKPKLLTLTSQGRVPILRLTFDMPGKPSEPVEQGASSRNETTSLDDDRRIISDASRSEEHVLRLVSKGDPDLALLRYVPERTSTPVNPTNPSLDGFLALETRQSVASPEENGVDVGLWSDALAYELEKKKPSYHEDSKVFDEPIDGRTSKEDISDRFLHSRPVTPKSLQNLSSLSPIGKKSVSGSLSAPETPRGSYSESRRTRDANFYGDDLMAGSSSAPVTPFRGRHDVVDTDSTCGELGRTNVKDSAPDTPQSRGNYSVGNGEEDLSSTGEELESGMLKRSPNEDEEDRKHLSTPDDERSSDSGFRDKESCEEEESPVPDPQIASIILGGKSGNPGNSSPLSASAEEEQMRILFELDTILDAEYYGNFRDSEKMDDSETSLDKEKIGYVDDKARSVSESHDSTESTEILRTVRPSSCDPNFFENCVERRTNDEENSVDLLESTEADSVSEFLKIEESRSDSRKEDPLADSSNESPTKTEKISSTDSSGELARFNFDSSNSHGKDGTNLASKTESSPEFSLGTIDRNSSASLSLGIRLDTSDSTSSSGETDRKVFSPRTVPDNFSPVSVLHEEPASQPSPVIQHTRDESISKSHENEDKLDSLVPQRTEQSPKREDREKLHADDEKPSTNVQESSKIVVTTKNSSRSPERSVADTEKLSKEWESEARGERDESNEMESSLTESLLRDSETKDSRCENLSQEWFLERHEERIDSPSFDRGDRRTLTPEILNEVETLSLEESPLKLDGETRDSSVSMEQWSSRENIDELNENEDGEDSSTMSLRSDNSYVSFGLDEEFVTAIRNELREKLPRAQMPVVEALDPHDEKEAASINPETSVKSWSEEDEISENPERSSVDISIRYNVYGTPLSPIMEERESAGTSESLVSKEESGDASIASRVSALSEDLLVVDTRTNRAIIVEASPNGNPETSNSQQDDDRDTTHGDFSDEENLEYPQCNLNRSLENKRISMGSGGAPLPSPEEESKWQQQFPLPLQMQDDLMSTSFGTDRDWDSQDDEEGIDEAEDAEDDEEENSSSSGEFVWKRYDESHGDLENVATRSPPNKPKREEREIDLDEEDEEGDEEDDEEEEEFTPSAWDATLAPHKSALRSPEKNLKSGDQKKSVCFKKQRYHCVYEYPKETPVFETPDQTATTWEPTAYTDWEDMMDEPRLDIYPIDYVETNRTGDEEFYVSSSNRPFQFQSGEGKYVSQFFPGASTTLLQHEVQHQASTSSSSSSSVRETDDSQASQDEVDRGDFVAAVQGNSRGSEIVENQQQTQLGELRHTRDRLKLNLLSTSGLTKADEETKFESRGDNLSNTEQFRGSFEMSLDADNPKETLENVEQAEKPIKIIGETNADIVDSGPSDDEKTENLETLENTRGNIEACSTDDAEGSSGIAKDTNKRIVRSEDIDNPDELEKSSSEASSSKIQKNVQIINDVSVKSESEISESRLIPVRVRDDGENVKIDENVDSKVDIVGQSSNLTNVNNLAVNEASKAKGKEEMEESEVRRSDGETLKIDKPNVEIKTVEESKSSRDSERQPVETFEEDSVYFGDQKQESSRSSMTIDTKSSEVLDTPKSSSDKSSTSTGEEMGRGEKSEKAEFSSHS